MPTPAYADGSMQFGSQTVAIDGETYTCKNIKVKRTRRRLMQLAANGQPFQKVHISGLTEGSATLQLQDADQAAPAQDEVFTLIPVGGAGTVSYVTEDVEDTYEIEGETFCDITFSAKLT